MIPENTAIYSTQPVFFIPSINARYISSNDNLSFCKHKINELKMADYKTLVALVFPDRPQVSYSLGGLKTGRHLSPSTTSGVPGEKMQMRNSSITRFTA